MSRQLVQFHSSAMKLVASILLTVLVSLSPDDALADLSPPKSPQAKVHNDQGNRYYKVQEFEKAVVEYQAGAELEDAPIFLYNLGQCHRQLGNYDKASWFYKRYLNSGKVDAEVAMYVRDFIKVMKAKKEQELKDKPPVEPAPSHDAGAKPPLAPRSIPAARWYHDWVGWGLSGVGAASVGVGLGLLLNASGLERGAQLEADQVLRNALRDNASDRRMTGMVFGTVGTVLLITGGIKLAIVSASRKTATSVWLAPRPRGLAVAGRF